MIQITGYKKRSGEFKNDRGENIAYNTYAFYFLTDEDPNVRGLSTELRGTKALSVSVNKLKDITGCDSPDDVVNRKYHAPVFEMAYGRPRLAPLVPLAGASNK